MLVFNRSIYDYYLKNHERYLPAGSSLEVTDEDWLADDQLAKVVESLDKAGAVMVSNHPVGYPRTTAFPLVINIIGGDGSSEVPTLEDVLAAGRDANGWGMSGLDVVQVNEIASNDLDGERNRISVTGQMVLSTADAPTGLSANDISLETGRGDGGGTSGAVIHIDGGFATGPAGIIFEVDGRVVFSLSQDSTVFYDSNGDMRLRVMANGEILFPALPTVLPDNSNALWNDNGVLKIS